MVGQTSAESHASPAQLLELAPPILEDWRASQEQVVLDEWRGEVGREGRASAAGRTPSRQRRTVASRLSSSSRARQGGLALSGLRSPDRVRWQVPARRHDARGAARRPRPRRAPDAQMRRQRLRGQPGTRPRALRGNRRHAPLLKRARRRRARARPRALLRRRSVRAPAAPASSSRSAPESGSRARHPLRGR